MYKRVATPEDFATALLRQTGDLLETVEEVLNGISEAEYNLKLNYTCPKHNRPLKT